MKLFVRPAAAAELEEAFGWYEDQRPGLGDQLLQEVQRAMSVVIDNPRRFPVVHRGTRRLLLKSFPYSIYYRVQSETVVVLAFFHGSRDPRLWQARD